MWPIILTVLVLLDSSSSRVYSLQSIVFRKLKVLHKCKPSLLSDGLLYYLDVRLASRTQHTHP